MVRSIHYYEGAAIWGYRVNYENKGNFTINGQRLKHYGSSKFCKEKSTVNVKVPE